MREYFNPSTVVFIELGDIEVVNNQLKFKYDLYGKPLLIMLGGDFCPHCTHNAPIFNSFAQKYKKQGNSEAKIYCGVIQVDGTPNEVEMAKKINGVLPDIRGVPTFLLFGPDGFYKKMNTGPMTIENMEKFSFQ